MKKVMGDPEQVVGDALLGMSAAYPELLTVRQDPAVVLRAGGPRVGEVAVISGGGSGHEPLHAGFVGDGMLAAACPGPVFTSPTPDQMAAAIEASDSGAGVLLIVKNYTGDVLNFETAAELAEAEGHRVRTVVIDDDVAVTDSTHTAGRRGVGGTVLLEKIAGAAAAEGTDLDGCAALAEGVIAAVRSMGLALSAPTVPHVGEPSFTLAEDEMELGIGIHGEPGRERVPFTDAEHMVGSLLDPILADLPFAAGDEVLLFTDSLGATPQLELFIAHGIAERLLAERDIRVTRRLVGPYITSLDMSGISFTVLRMDGERTRYWDAPVHTPALRWGR
ncbi:dihydroxyacetone kinase subunit DhaK [Sciscionella sediminilitoris]|uniref:dihydroxyacetone kinase subunit DhaK n=1 Tax=Sciscionella sediminilitoris TaxID=1445613 RepID=UPI0004DFBCB1|nr:dihydroxyacetone kinase subunit DhaK [Sciscionella sp. SE31]